MLAVYKSYDMYREIEWIRDTMRANHPGMITEYLFEMYPDPANGDLQPRWIVEFAQMPGYLFEFKHFWYIDYQWQLLWSIVVGKGFDGSEIIDEHAYIEGAPNRPPYLLIVSNKYIGVQMIGGPDSYGQISPFPSIVITKTSLGLPAVAINFNNVYVEDNGYLKSTTPIVDIGRFSVGIVDERTRTGFLVPIHVAYPRTDLYAYAYKGAMPYFFIGRYPVVGGAPSVEGLQTQYGFWYGRCVFPDT